MKKLIIFGALAFLTLSATANEVAPGSSVEHILRCDNLIDGNGDMLIGGSYLLKCATAALSPRYNLQGCTLLTKAAVPNAVARETELKMNAQSTRMASLSNNEIKVLFDKGTFSADLIIGEATGTCKSE